MARIGHIPKSQLYAGPGYNLFDPPPGRQFEEETTFLNKNAMKSAAEAFRATEIEANESDDTDSCDTDLEGTYLYGMNINELRVVARLFEVSNCDEISDRRQLIVAIERAMQR